MRFKYYLRGCGLGILLTAIILTIGFHRNGTREMSDAEVIQRAASLGMVMRSEQISPETENTQTTQEDDSSGNSGDSQSGGKDTGKKDTQKDNSGAKDSEAKDSEAKDSEEKDTGKKNSESQKTDSKNSESQKSDSKNSESQKSDSKNSESKNSESKNSESGSKNSESGNKNSEKNDADNQGSGEGDAQPEKIVFTIKRGEYCRKISENLYEKGLVADAEAFRLYMRDNGYDNLVQVGSFELTVGMDYKEIAKIITDREKRI